MQMLLLSTIIMVWTYIETLKNVLFKTEVASERQRIHKFIMITKWKHRVNFLSENMTFPN